mgnify:CR=1 FL=1
MNEYRDIIVVFMALALVSLLIFVAATIQVPSGPASGNMNAKKKSVSSARIRFGEPVIDVKRKTAGPFSTNAAEKTGSVEVQANKLDGNEPLTFTEYVFPINANGMRKAIESISPALGECYQQWRSLDENVGVGAWEATFYFEQSRKVEKTSRVDNVALEHPSPDAQVMEQCMMEMFGMLRFEETGPRKFKHPLVFQ